MLRVVKEETQKGGSLLRLEEQNRRKTREKSGSAAS